MAPELKEMDAYELLQITVYQGSHPRILFCSLDNQQEKGCDLGKIPTIEVYFFFPTFLAFVHP
jgi:hypothetical protein